MLRIPATAFGKKVRCPCGKTIEIDDSGKRKREPATGDLFGQTAPNAIAGSDDAGWLDEIPEVATTAYAPSANGSPDFYSAPPAPSYADENTNNAYSPPRSNSTTANNYLAQAEAERRRDSTDPHSRVDWGFNGGMGTGVLMMVGAVVWFFGGLAAGYIFFYPPILLITGMITFIKSIGD